MTVLALDTTSEFGSLAIRRDGIELAQRSVHAANGHAHRIFAELEELKSQARLASFAEVDCFAAAHGPGSFTGVRVGLSIAKGMAEALGKKAAAISNLQAVSSFGKVQERAVILDARRGDVFVAVYDALGRIVRPELLAKLPEWLTQLPGSEYDFISQAETLVHAALLESRFAGQPVIQAPRELASAIAAIAEQSEWLDPAALDANYVRRSDAESFWSDR